MNNHFIVIGILMVIIVGLQISVFNSTLNKINLFKSIFPKVKNFKTIKVYIPENQLDEITLDSVWQNLEVYSSRPIAESNSDLLLELTADQDINEDIPGNIKYIIIRKGDAQQRIDANYFDNYYKDGWQFYKNDEASTSSINNSKKRKRTVTVTKGPVTEQVGIELANVYEKAGWSIVANN